MSSKVTPPTASEEIENSVLKREIAPQISLRESLKLIIKNRPDVIPALLNPMNGLPRETILAAMEFNPEFEAECRRFMEANESKGDRAFSIGWDPDEGFFIVTKDKLAALKRKYPAREYHTLALATGLKTKTQETVVTNPGKRLFTDNGPPTDSRKKELERKLRYYYRHREKLLEYQKDYDKAHKPEIHYRDKFYYNLRKSGITQVYSVMDWEGKRLQMQSSHEEKSEESST